jgi:type IV pilus biogenesis/stability protein PilW
MLKSGMSKMNVMTKNSWPKLVTLTSALLLSACVTQSFENDTPIVENNASNNEMAATRISLGLGYLNMGNMTQAKLNLEKAKRFAPDLVQVYTAFAHYYETVGEDELTVQSFEKALSIAPDDADTLNNYGVFLCRQDKVHQAEVQLLKAIAVPSYLLVAQSYENLASCYLQIDDFTKAEQYLNKAIAHSPNRTVTLLQMVRLQYGMGNYKEAKKFQQKFERNTHRFSPDSLALAYKVHWKLGQRKTAKNYANMLVRMYPQAWESKQYLLNELEHIEADELAQRYYLTQRKNKSTLSNSNSKKRVVKLSPKKRNNPQLAAQSADSIAAPVTTPLAVTKKSVTLAAVSSYDSNEANDFIVPVVIEKNEAMQDKKKTEQAGDSSTTPQKLTSVKTEIIAGNAESLESVVSTNNTKELTSSNATKVNDAELTLVDETAALPAVVVTSKLSVEEPDKVVSVESAAVPSIIGSGSNVKEAIPSSETFTKPVPAKRDAPLPEVIEYVEEEVLVDNTAENKPETQVLTEEKTEVVTEKTTDAVIEKTNQTGLVDNEAVLDIKAVENVDVVAVKPKRHTVIKGESLFAISVKYNVKIDALRKWNKMSTKQSLHAGKKLYIENPDTVNNINE